MQIVEVQQFLAAWEEDNPNFYAMISMEFVILLKNLSTLNLIALSTKAI